MSISKAWSLTWDPNQRGEGEEVPAQRCWPPTTLLAAEKGDGGAQGRHQHLHCLLGQSLERSTLDTPTDESWWHSAPLEPSSGFEFAFHSRRVPRLDPTHFPWVWACSAHGPGC